MKRNLGWLGVVMLAAMMLVALAPAPAVAGIVGTVETFTIPLGEAGSTSTLTIQMSQSNIKDVYLWCPTLDASDTATVSMTYTAFSSNSDATIAAAEVVPNGWTNKVIGATADNAIVSVFSSANSIYVDGPVNLTVTCSSEQVADRVFFVLFVREY